MASWMERGWYLVPAALVLAASLCFAIVEFLPGLHYIAPWLSFAVVFYWLAYCPRCLPSWFLFLAGLLHDGLYGAPLGLSSALYLTLQCILSFYRHLLVREGFLAMCLVFTTLSFFWCGFRFGLSSFAASAWLPVAPILWQWLLTCLLYPPLHLGLNRLFYSSPFFHTHAS